MKVTAALWALIFVITFLTGGFFPALLVTGLTIGASVRTGLVAQQQWAQLDPAVQRKMLERGK